MSTTDHTNDKKVGKVLAKIFALITKAKLSIPELLVLYGNLGYHLGASMAHCITGKGPNLTRLKQYYYSKPTVDVGLMIQGLMITDWEKDFIAHPQLSSLAISNKEKEEKQS